MAVYKQQDSVTTGIHTRVSSTMRISSAWRTYENVNFRTQAWETLLWNGDRVIAEYDTLKDADDVIELHQRILSERSSYDDEENEN